MYIIERIWQAAHNQILYDGLTHVKEIMQLKLSPCMQAAADLLIACCSLNLPHYVCTFELVINTKNLLGTLNFEHHSLHQY